MDTRKVYLEENKDVNSVNEQSFVGINLTTKSKLLPYNNISDVLNLNNLYIAERNACTKYRLILTVNPICSNVLFNYRTEVVRYEGSSACTSLIYDSEIPPEPTPYKLIVTPENLSFENRTLVGKQITITTENQGWRIISYPDWLDISETSGEEGTITITITPNNTVQEERSGNIIIKGTENGQKTVQVVQEGSEPILDYVLTAEYVDGLRQSARPPRWLKAYLRIYNSTVHNPSTLVSEEDVTTRCTWEWYINESPACIHDNPKTEGYFVNYDTSTHTETGNDRAWKIVRNDEPLHYACPLDQWKCTYITPDSKTLIGTFSIYLF